MTLDFWRTAAIFVIVALGSAAGNGIASYMKKKFANQADKEDLGDLTREVEKVKSAFA